MDANRTLSQLSYRPIYFLHNAAASGQDISRHRNSMEYYIPFLRICKEQSFKNSQIFIG